MDRVYLTEILRKVDCDVFFPDFPGNAVAGRESAPLRVSREYREVPRPGGGGAGNEAEIREENGFRFVFRVFKRSE